MSNIYTYGGIRQNFILLVKIDKLIILDTSFDIGKIAKKAITVLANYKITTDKS